MSHPESYREQNACANCKHVCRYGFVPFISTNFGEWGFCKMRLDESTDTDKDTSIVVKPSGICDEWEGEEGELEADADIAAGRVESFDSMEEFIETLPQGEEGDGDVKRRNA